MTVRALAWVFLCTVLVSGAWASPGALPFADPYFENVSTDDDLPDNNVYVMAQDHDGFIWAGTPNGLFRYDGYRYQRADLSTGQGGGGSPFIRSILVARNGRLWMGTEADGLYSLDPRSGAIQNFKNVANDPGSLIHDRVIALAEDSSGSLWVGTHTGLDRLQPQTRSFEHIQHPLLSSQGGADRRVTALLADRTGDLWIGTWDGLRRRQHTSGEISATGLHDGADTLPKGSLRSLLELEDGNIAVGAALSGIYIFNPEGRLSRQTTIVSKRSPATTNLSVFAMIQPNPEELWLAGVGEIVIVSSTGAEVRQHMRHDDAVDSSPADSQINTMVKGQTGEIWIGSYSGGLQRYHPNNQSISILRHGQRDSRTLTRSNVSSVLAVDNGQIWVGTRDNGVDILDRRHGVIGGIRPGAKDAGAIQNSWITSMAQTKDRSVWIGVGGNGVVRIAPDTLSPLPLQLPARLQIATIRTMRADRDGGLWMGTVIGLAHWRPTPDQPLAAGVISMAGGDQVSGDINAIVEAPDGRLWVGSGSAGLYTMPTGSTDLRRVQLTHATNGDVIQPSVVGILIDRDETLWVDSAQGLYQVVEWNNSQGKALPMGELIGLPGRPLGANLLQDAAGLIWTPRFVFDKKKQSVYELLRSDGAYIGTPWYRSFDQTADGLLLYGGSSGLLVIDPERFRPASTSAPLRATSTAIDGEMVSAWSAPSIISIPSGARAFRVEFAALDYFAARRVRYEYRLRGYESDWNQTDATRRSANYGDLPPGNYTLEVHAVSRSGIVASNSLTIPVEVKAAYWQTSWFALASAGLIGLLILAGFRVRTASIQRRAADLEKNVVERTRELRDQIAAREVVEQTLQRRNADLGIANQKLVGTQNQLIQSEKMATVGVLAAGVAHEINNPIGFIKSNLSSLNRYFDDFTVVLKAYEALEQTVAEEQPQLKLIYELRAQVELDYLLGDVPGLIQETLSGIARVESIVSDLKGFSHMDGAEWQEVDLLKGLERTLNVAANELKYKVTVVREFSDLPLVTCLPFQINQVFLNLLINAAQAIEGNGTITIRTGHDDTTVWLQFSDTGRGIADEHRSRIFEPFFTTKPVGLGTGLGLSVSYSIIQKHGGSIDVQSEVGKGATFTIHLPRSQTLAVEHTSACQEYERAWLRRHGPDHRPSPREDGRD